MVALVMVVGLLILAAALVAGSFALAGARTRLDRSNRSDAEVDVLFFNYQRYFAGAGFVALVAGLVFWPSGDAGLLPLLVLLAIGCIAAPFTYRFFYSPPLTPAQANWQRLLDMRKPELIAHAKASGLRGYSRLKVDELRHLCQDLFDDQAELDPSGEMSDSNPESPASE